MRIKELEDVLTLVDEMPREQQLWCVKALSDQVQSWEGQQSEGVEDYAEWVRLQMKRSCELVRRYGEQVRAKKKPPG